VSGKFGDYFAELGYNGEVTLSRTDKAVEEQLVEARQDLGHRVAACLDQSPPVAKLSLLQIPESGGRLWRPVRSPVPCARMRPLLSLCP
jgi:hypothetical protein